MREGGASDAGDPVLVGIDVGTTSVRALAFDLRGGRVASHSVLTPTKPSDTGGEYDPDAVFTSVLACLSGVAKALAGRPIAGMAVASFGESCVLVDEKGKALAPSIVWHDRRTEAQGLAIERAVGRDRIFEISGHSVEPIFTLAKLMWMRTHWPEAMSAARHVLMMADWIAFRLSGVMASDPTLASRTLYFDIRRRGWSGEMLALAGVTADFPASLAANGASLGPVRREVIAETGLAGEPIVAVGGHDHIIGAIATGLNEPGAVINSIGTAEALLFASSEPLGDPEVLRRGYVQGAIETDRRFCYMAGALLSAGGAIEWLRAIVGNIPHEKLIEEASAVPAGSNGVIFLPHLVNGPPPVPDPYGRGAFFGLTPSVTPAVLYRAVLEGLAFQSRMMLDGMIDLPGAAAISGLRFVGGTSRNRLFLSIKASVFGRPMTIVEESEATALAAALLAGVGAGLYPNIEAALAGLRRREYVMEPDAFASRYDELRTAMFEPVVRAMQPINRRLRSY